MIEDLRNDLAKLQQDQQAAADAVKQAEANFHQLTGAIRYVELKIQQLAQKEDKPDNEE